MTETKQERFFVLHKNNVYKKLGAINVCVFLASFGELAGLNCDKTKPGRRNRK